MSRTKRSILVKEKREKIKDYYITPVNKIVEFLNEIIKYEPTILNGIILDPCAGGDAKHPMSYPEALKQFNVNVRTIDIREDSLAETKGDYLKIKLDYRPKTIITNPPFNRTEEIIKKSIKRCRRWWICNNVT